MVDVAVTTPAALHVEWIIVFKEEFAIIASEMALAVADDVVPVAQATPFFRTTPLIVTVAVSRPPVKFAEATVMAVGVEDTSVKLFAALPATVAVAETTSPVAPDVEAEIPPTLFKRLTSDTAVPLDVSAVFHKYPFKYAVPFTVITEFVSACSRPPVNLAVRTVSAAGVDDVIVYAFPKRPAVAAVA